MPVGATQLAPASTTRVYIRLSVYNYDASPRCQVVKHVCKSIDAAKRLSDRLRRLIGTRGSDNGTTRWLDRNKSIYGLVERVEGIFSEVTTRIE